MVRAQNAFALDLYRRLGAFRGDGNLFLSPYSAFSALAMTAEGARFETAEEMGRVLHLDPALRRQGPEAAQRPWDFERIHEGLGSLSRAMVERSGGASVPALRSRIDSLRTALAAANEAGDRLVLSRDPTQAERSRQEAGALADTLNELQSRLDRYELRVANALWGERRYRFDPAFQRTIAAHYGTGAVRPVDFRGHAEEARQQINAWAADQTRQRIRDLLPPGSVNDSTGLLLTNAIYFKGQWAEVFDSLATREEPFRLASGTARVPLMRGSLERARYGAFRSDGSVFPTPWEVPRGTLDTADDPKLYPGVDGLQILELPYRGGDLAMVVLLTGTPAGLEGLEAELTPERLDAWLGQMQRREVSALLPKFKLEQGGELTGALRAMGMQQAFVRFGARFDGMTVVRDPDSLLFVGDVFQKAYMEVSERGTEAAAATAVVMHFWGGPGPPTVPFVPTFRADRPFLFLIRDVRSGCILFLGRFARP